MKVTTALPGWVGVRDSKLGTDSPVLACTRSQWRATLTATQAGEPGLAAVRRGRWAVPLVNGHLHLQSLRDRQQRVTEPVSATRHNETVDAA